MEMLTHEHQPVSTADLPVELLLSVHVHPQLALLLPPLCLSAGAGAASLRCPGTHIAFGLRVDEQGSRAGSCVRRPVDRARLNTTAAGPSSDSRGLPRPEHCWLRACRSLEQQAARRAVSVKLHGFFKTWKRRLVGAGWRYTYEVQQQQNKVGGTAYVPVTSMFHCRMLLEGTI